MVYLATYVANGHIQTFSLPSLKPLLDVDFLPSTDIRSVTPVNVLMEFPNFEVFSPISMYAVN